ncbi:type IV toxin-antitoxin system AbiEi family antitoxin domain-containing protein [Enteractinococcus helveticum]|uniref:AbiEi antitoxin N-terminal domain-containing protein n=1 Tax=Enteractinococcus helveticum TaxID=1837282 RepID=A0A1B7M2N6_9MICC|nr:hypothetical protein A6F49_04145 [Enteractinococcus helveticum]
MYQQGIVTTCNADELDIPVVELRKLAQRGPLRRLGHGVYRFDDFPQTVDSTEAEAVAMVGGHVYLEGKSVLALLGLGHAKPARIEIATTRQNRRILPRWIQVTQRTTLKVDETTRYHGVPSVYLQHTLRQIQHKIPRLRWEEAIEQAANRELLGPSQVRTLLTPK